MSSTTEWRKLSRNSSCTPANYDFIRDALSAACTRLDEQANLLGIANEQWGKTIARAEAAEARVAELEAKLNHESYVSDKRALERDKAEARLAVAVEALDTYAQFARNGEMTFVSGALAQGALAKLRGEP